jgi:RimJ/RimL family protein N-acetyltransferase
MKDVTQTIILKKVTKSDCPFLYELLSQRNSRTNISHKKMPDYDEHVKFVLSKPYSKWYIILFKNQKAGSIYLTRQNEIGIFIKKGMQERGIGKQALQLLMKLNPRTRYLANINPKNTKSIKFFKKSGFYLIQHTYEIINPSMK